MQYHNYKSGKNRGQALVEFALVLPVLLILTMFIIQYGIIFYTAIGLTNLSREGARFAATAPISSDSAQPDKDILQRMQDVLPPNIKWTDVAPPNTVISATPSTSRYTNSGGLITVTITYDMKKKLFLPSTFLGVTVFSSSYTTQTTMMIE